MVSRLLFCGRYRTWVEFEVTKALFEIYHEIQSINLSMMVEYLFGYIINTD